MKIYKLPLAIKVLHANRPFIEHWMRSKSRNLTHTFVKSVGAYANAYAFDTSKVSGSDFWISFTDSRT